MSGKYLSFFVVALLVLFGSAAHAGKHSVDEIQERLRQIDSFSTDFQQELIDSTTQEAQTRKGRIVYQRPGNIYWETQVPQKEALILNRDEDVVWNVVYQEKMAYKYSRKEVLDSGNMLDFITGEVNLREEFDVAELEAEQEGRVLLELIPREPTAEMVEAEVSVDREDMLLRRIKILDFFGNQNILNFENIHLGYQPEEDLFRYRPPEDFRVVDRTGESEPLAPEGGMQ